MFFFSFLCLLCLCTRLFICALWLPAGKGLTSWLSFVVSNCEFVTFPLVSWVRFGTLLYRFLIFAPLLTFMMSLSYDKQAGIIDAFNTTSRYLDDILNSNYVYFGNMVSQIYPSELQLNKANTSGKESALDP